jgi:hypothetical protein
MKASISSESLASLHVTEPEVDTINNQVHMPLGDCGSRSVDMPRNLPPSVRVLSETKWEANSTAEEPMSPLGRAMEDLGVYIIVVMGLGESINLHLFRAGIKTELLPRSQRFRSIQVIFISIKKLSFISVYFTYLGSEIFFQFHI